MNPSIEKYGRLIEAGLNGFWLVTPDVNLDDLIDMKPGQIVRSQSIDSVRFIAADTQDLQGCIAGWISDEPEDGPA